MFSRLIKGLLLVIVVATAAIIYLLPALLAHGLPQLAARDGLDLQIGQVESNLARTRYVLRDVQLGGTEPALHIGELQLRLYTPALLSRSITFARAAVRNAQLPLPWQAGSLLPADSDLVRFLSAFRVSSVELDDVVFRPRDPGGNTWHVSHARFARLPAPGGSGSIPLDVEAGTGALALRLRGDLQVYATEYGFDGQVQASGLPAQWLQDELAGALDLDWETVALTARPDGQDLKLRFTGSMEGRDLAAPGGLGAAQAAWTGAGELQGGWPLALRTAQLDGDTRAEHFGAGDGLAGSGLLLKGVTRWEDAAEAGHQLRIRGDGEVAQLTLGQPGMPPVTLERGRFWGLDTGTDDGVRLGKLHASRVYLAADGDTGTTTDTAWTLADMDADTLDWPAGGGLAVGQLDTGLVNLRLAGQQAYADALHAGALRIGTDGLGMESLRLTGVVATAPADSLAQTRIAELTLLGIKRETGRGLSVDKLQADSLETHGVRRDADSGWQFPGLLVPEPPAAIGLLTLLGRNRITLSDFSVEPRARLELDNVTLRLSNWQHGSAADADGQLALAGQWGEQGSLDLDGSGGADGWHLRAQFKHLPVPAVGGYAVRLADLQGLDGLLDATADIVTTADGWSGRMALDAERLQPQATAEPGLVELALPWLVDNRHGVRLDLALPVDGPGLQQAVLNRLLADYPEFAIQTPTRLAAGRLDLPPVAYRADGGSSRPAPASALDRLASLLSRHPAVSAQLCSATLDGGSRHPAAQLGDWLRSETALPESRIQSCRNDNPDRVNITLRTAPWQPAP